MRRLVFSLLVAIATVITAHAQLFPPAGGGGGNSAPTGAAGGDLSGTYPNPTVHTLHVTGGTASGLTITGSTFNGSISGSSINGTAIGGTTPAAGAFTSLTANSGTLNGVSIGATTRGAGAFTALSSNGTVMLTNGAASIGITSGVLATAGAWTHTGAMNVQGAVSAVSVATIPPTDGNLVTLAPAATGASPTITASGGDANVGITLAPKGSGAVLVSGALQANGLLTAAAGLRPAVNTLASLPTCSNVVSGEVRVVSNAPDDMSTLYNKPTDGSDGTTITPGASISTVVCNGAAAKWTFH